MNWKWLLPVIGLVYLLRDDLDNVANDYMKYRLPLGFLYHFCLGLISIVIIAESMEYLIQLMG